MMNEPSKELITALAVTAELTGAQLSAGAARVFARDLSGYPEAMVIAALDRCRKELRGRLTVAEVVSRLDDGRPGPEEAWAMIRDALSDERVSVVWTEEMSVASGAARAIIDDRIAARMAFLESYRTSVQRARDAGTPVKWVPCLGWDAAGREGPLREAARLGRLSAAHIAGLLPHREEPPAEIAGLIQGQKLIEGKRERTEP